MTKDPSTDDRLANVRADLAAQFGREPSESDVKWRLQLEDWADAVKREDRGEILVGARRMAQQLIKEAKHADALAMLAVVIVMEWADPWSQDLDPWERLSHATKYDLEQARIRGALSLDATRDVFLRGARAIPVVPLPNGLTPDDTIPGTNQPVSTLQRVDPELVWHDISTLLGA